MFLHGVFADDRGSLIRTSGARIPDVSIQSLEVPIEEILQSAPEGPGRPVA